MFGACAACALLHACPDQPAETNRGGQFEVKSSCQASSPMFSKASVRAVPALLTSTST